MKIEGTFLFESMAADTVWEFLTSPDRIVLCLPGCEKLVQTGEGKYSMNMSIGIGAIRGKFSGTIELLDVHPTTDYRMKVSGAGAPGFVNGDGLIRLTGTEAGTRVDYSGEVSAGGAIASVGQRMIGGAAHMVIEKFFKCAASQS